MPMRAVTQKSSPTAPRTASYTASTNRPRRSASPPHASVRTLVIGEENSEIR